MAHPASSNHVAGIVALVFILAVLPVAFIRWWTCGAVTPIRNGGGGGRRAARSSRIRSASHSRRYAAAAWWRTDGWIWPSRCCGTGPNSAPRRRCVRCCRIKPGIMLDRKVPTRTFYDWDWLCTLLAAQQPSWHPKPRTTNRRCYTGT